MYGDPVPDYADASAGGIGGGIVGGLVAGLAGLYDSHQNRKTSERNTDKTIAAQKAEAELAYQRSIEQWHRQNLYNSPEAQMNRFKAAGLNPHLIYGQGNAGNASSPAEYHAPNLQYRYQAPAYGAAVNSILPTLMSVGTWMQNMRSSEIENQAKITNTQKSAQLIDYLEKANPKTLAQMDNRLSLFPYQYSMQQSLTEKSWAAVRDLQNEYRYRWGASVFDKELPDEIGGMKAIERLRKLSENKLLDQKFQSGIYQNKLLEAQSSWTDFSITNPQSIMQLVLSGVMGLAGQKLRMSTYSGGNKNMRGKERPRGLVRSRMSSFHPDRR